MELTNEERYLKLALGYKDQWTKTNWWRFAKRRYLKSMHRSGLDMALRELNSKKQ